MSTYEVPRLHHGGQSGHHVKRVYLYAAGGVVIIGAVLWTRRRSQAVTVPEQPTDTSGYDDSYTDSGLYGDPGSSPITDGGVYGTTPGVYPGNYPGPVNGQPTTNAQWTQQCLSLMQQQGFNQTAVAVALGLYLSGHGLTQHQYELVQAAVSIGGYPPVPVPPPHIISTNTGQTQQLHAGPQLTIASQSRTSAVLHWTSIPGATHYRLRRASGIVVADVQGQRHTVNRPKTTQAHYIVTAYQGNKQVSKDSNTLVVTPHN